MLKCKECGHTAARFEAVCPECKKEYSLTRIEIEDSLDEARTAMKKREYDYSLTIFRTLADMGVTEAEREYAAILERGAVLPRDLDGAMRYFGAAAKKNDPYSAYRYSRLAARTSDKASDFWLAFSAVLGCKEAFLPVAEYYSDIGDEETAGYYYALAAHGDETEAIVTMAKRYYTGVGVAKSEAHARWYMDKLPLPPLQALKLAYKLRGVKAEIPPEPRFTSRSRILRGLIRDAKKYELETPLIFMAELLSKDGAADSLYSLAVLYADGVGGKVRIAEAISLLEEALKKGSAEAAKYLGDIYTSGKLVERNIEKALAYYRHSAGLGEGGAYEIMGDIFCEGKMVETNVAYAIELYEQGSREGDQACRTKAAKLREEREDYYRLAKSEEKNDPEYSFQLFGASCAMGYLPAHKELARAFELGIGTKKNRKLAFVWYSLAAENGDTDSLFDLGRCYSRGIGTHFDFETAIKILTQAKRYGSTEAEGEIARLYNNKKKNMLRSLFSNGVRLIYSKKFTEAFGLLSACSELGYPEGSYVLGCMHEFGLGVPTSRTAAFECYNKAFDAGFRDPRQTYKLKILKMAR